MRLRHPSHERSAPVAKAGSVLIVVLWIAAAIVAITLFFARSMTMELRAADERAAGLAAEQAIEAAVRYVSMVITNYGTNGYALDPSLYQASGVQVGQARFWLIGRDPSGQSNTVPNFGLIDESSKLNLNTVDTNWLNLMTNMTTDFAAAIGDWRSTNSTGTMGYGQADRPYTDKNAPFETVDELMLVYGSTPWLVAAEDHNRNGVLDPDEEDINHNGSLDTGLMEYATVYSQEPNTFTNGTAKTSLSDANGLRTMIAGVLGQGVADSAIPSPAGGARGGGARGGGPGGGTTGPTYASALDLYVQSGMTAAQFAQIAPYLATSTNGFTQGRVNVNSAPLAVLACLPGLDANSAQQLATYRTANAGNLGSVAWVADCLGANSAAVALLKSGDYITTFSYQFMADVAAVGPNGRGYRRTRFIIDTTTGTPYVLYRQDLTRLGWALGKRVRDKLLASDLR